MSARCDAALALDVDLVDPVDHDLGHRRVGQQRLQHAEADRLVDHLADQARALGGREHRPLARDHAADDALQARAALWARELGELGEVDLLEQPAAVEGDAVAVGDGVDLLVDAVLEAHQPGSSALREVRRLSLSRPGHEDRDADAHGRLLPLHADDRVLAQARRERRLAGLLGVAAAAVDAARGAGGVGGLVDGPGDQQQLPDHEGRQQQPEQHAGELDRRLARLVLQPCPEPAHVPASVCEGSNGSSSIDVPASEVIRHGEATDGIRTGHLELHAHGDVVGAVDRRVLEPRLREVLLRLVAVVLLLLGVGRVGGQLAGALAGGVPGEHVRVADQPDLPQQDDDREQQRQQAGELDRGLAALAREACEQAARLLLLLVALLLGGGDRLHLCHERVEHAAQLLILHARRRAGVDGGLEGREVGRHRGLGQPAADDLAGEVGLHLALARGLVEHDERLLVVVAHLQAAPHVAQPAHAAQRHDVGRGDDERLARHLGADRARLRDGGAEVDHGQRVP